MCCRWCYSLVRKRKALVAFAAPFRCPAREASEFWAVAYPAALFEDTLSVRAWVRVVRLEVFAISAGDFRSWWAMLFGALAVKAKPFRTSVHCQRAGRFRFGCHGLDWVEGVGVAAFPARGRPATLGWLKASATAVNISSSRRSFTAIRSCPAASLSRSDFFDRSPAVDGCISATACHSAFVPLRQVAAISSRFFSVLSASDIFPASHPNKSPVPTSAAVRLASVSVVLSLVVMVNPHEGRV